VNKCLRLDTKTELSKTSRHFSICKCSQEVAVRTSVLTIIILGLGGTAAFAQTSAPSSAPAAAPTAAPSASPSAAPQAAPGAPATGSPALTPNSSPLPGGGSVLPPSASFNSTPSQSNVDLNPPGRLTAPGAAAGPPLQGRTGEAYQGSGARPQPGGANSTAPGKAPKKTGSDYSANECMGFWDAGTHMTKAEWRAACIRVQDRLQNLEDVAEAVGTKKTLRRASR
jgi:hypothetical protein